MILLAFVPPLWFRVVDPIVVQHARAELDALNIFPSKRDALVAKYQLR
jgi:alkane 1-monooxygenase